MKHGITPTIYYCNPNIYPREEYDIRKNECSRYAQSLGLEIVDDDYIVARLLEFHGGMRANEARATRYQNRFLHFSLKRILLDDTIYMKSDRVGIPHPMFT